MVRSHERAPLLQTPAAQVALACAIPSLSGAVFSLNLFSEPLDALSSAHPATHGSLRGVWAPALSSVFYGSSLLMIPVGYVLSRRDVSRARAVRALMLLAGAAAFPLFGAAVAAGATAGSRVLVAGGVALVAVPLAVLGIVHVDHLAIWQPRHYGSVVGLSTVTFGVTNVLWAALFHALLRNCDIPVAVAVAAALCTAITLAITAMLRFPSEQMLARAALDTRTATLLQQQQQQGAVALSSSSIGSDGSDGSDGEQEDACGAARKKLIAAGDDAGTHPLAAQYSSIEAPPALSSLSLCTAPSSSSAAVAATGRAEVMDPDADKLSLSELRSSGAFWNFVLVVMCFAATFPLTPYFFGLASAHGISSLSALRWYELGSALSVGFNLGAAALSDHARTGRGRWRMGSRNVLLATMATQTGLFGLLAALQPRGDRTAWTVAATMQRLFTLSGYSMAAMLAGDVFGKQNVGIVVGFGRGLALGVGEAAATAVMVAVQSSAEKDGVPVVDRLPWYYNVGGVWSAAGLVALVSLRKFKPKQKGIYF